MNKLDNNPNEIDVSIVLPCLNEELSIEYCINNANEAGKLIKEFNLTYEVVISDNGSTDNSVQLAKQLGARVVNAPNKGYGNALDYGIRSSYGKYVVIGDCDGSYNFIESVPMIEKLLEGYDLCVGTRLKGTIKPGAMPWKNRYIGNPVLSGIMNLFFKTGISDAHCALRAFTKKSYLQMKLVSTGMEFIAEMVVKATQHNLKRCEVPITLSPDLRDRPPHLKPWRDGWLNLKFMLMFSPEWTFIIPSLILFCLGFIINIFIGIVPTTFLGLHSLIVADFSIVSSVVLISFAILNFSMGYKSGIRHRKQLLYKLYSISDIEKLGVISLIIILIGLYLLFEVIFLWVGSGFGSLDRLKSTLTACTLISCGGVLFLSTFLNAIIKDGWIKVTQDRGDDKNATGK